MDQRVNGSLVLIGANAGTVSVQAQPNGGFLTLQLPNTLPIIGQVPVVTNVQPGNVIVTGWTAVAPSTNPTFVGKVSVTDLSLSGKLIDSVNSVGTNGQFLVSTGSGVTWSASSGNVTSIFGRAGAVVAVSGDYTVSQVTGAAPLISPALTGVPTAPTASALTSNTQIASTAYADAAVLVEKTRALAAEALLAPLAGPTFTGLASMVNAKITGTLTDGSFSTGTNGQFLTSTHTGVLWADASGGSPAGSTGDFQINNAGSFGTFVDINAGSSANIAANGLLTIDLANGLSLTASGGFGIALVAAAASLFMQGTLVEINGAFASGDTIIGNSANVLTLHDPTLRDVVSMPDLPVFANNAAAISGGLSANNLYRTGADPDTICVVH